MNIYSRPIIIVLKRSIPKRSTPHVTRNQSFFLNPPPKCLHPFHHAYFALKGISHFPLHQLESPRFSKRIWRCSSNPWLNLQTEIQYLTRKSSWAWTWSRHRRAISNPSPINSSTRFKIITAHVTYPVQFRVFQLHYCCGDLTFKAVWFAMKTFLYSLLSEKEWKSSRRPRNPPPRNRLPKMLVTP